MVSGCNLRHAILSVRGLLACRAPTFPGLALVRILSPSLLIRAVAISRAVLRNPTKTDQPRNSIILFRCKSIFQSPPSLFLIPLTAERRNKRSRLSITYPDYLSFRFTRRKYGEVRVSSGSGKSERESAEQRAHVERAFLGNSSIQTNLLLAELVNWV